MTRRPTLNLRPSMKTDNHTYMRGRERVEEEASPSRVVACHAIDLWSTAMSLANDNMNPAWFRPVEPGLYASRSTTPLIAFGPDTVFLTSPNTVATVENFDELKNRYDLFDSRSYRSFPAGTLCSKSLRLVHGRGYDAMVIQIIRSIYEVLVNYAQELGVVYHNHPNVEPGRYLSEPEEHVAWPRLVELRRQAADREEAARQGYRVAKLSFANEEAVAYEREILRLTDPKEPLNVEIARLTDEVQSVYFQAEWLGDRMEQLREFIRQDFWNRYVFELRGSVLHVTKYEDQRIVQWEALARDINQGRASITITEPEE